MRPRADCRLPQPRQYPNLRREAVLSGLFAHALVHAKQWARLGFAGFLREYVWNSVWSWASTPFDGACNNWLEREAGFAGGGYVQCSG